MTAGEITGVVMAAAALVTAVSVLLAQIGHLIYHSRQDEQESGPPRGGNGTGPRP